MKTTRMRLWAGAVGAAATVLVAGGLLVAEDHDIETPVTTTAAVVETSAPAAETTTTTAPPGYGLVWHTGIHTDYNPTLTFQESLAVSDGLLYHAHRHGGVRVVPVREIAYFDYQIYGEDHSSYDSDHPDWGTISIYVDWGRDLGLLLNMRQVSDIAGLADELEEELGG